jgi:hypothetical protein
MDNQDRLPPSAWLFRLRAAVCLLAATAGAVFGGIAFGGPLLAATCYVGWSMFVPAAVTVGAIYAHGYQRTFWIGALFPAVGLMLCPTVGFILLGNSPLLDTAPNMLAALLATFGLTVLSGLVAASVRTLIELTSVSLPNDSDPPRSGESAENNEPTLL